MVLDVGPVSTTILVLLSFISLVLTAYVSIFCYGYYARRRERKNSTPWYKMKWLDKERSPLIPGNFIAQTVQPTPTHSDEEDENPSDLFKERDFSKFGRIIFIMRYSLKRQELMVRLVQIEGLPVSQEIYNPNSAYVDVQLKYTGKSTEDLQQQPPRLDICLQQVYYFIITQSQMMAHSLEFRINTFDDEFRRRVSGLVEVNLSEEMGDDILSGAEVVFVKEIQLPSGRASESSIFGTFHSSREALETFHHDELPISDCIEDRGSRSDSPAPSHMSWEPEVVNGLSVSTQSLCRRCSTHIDFPLNPLSNESRAHSVAYLPTYEWAVTEIALDDDNDGHVPSYVSPKASVSRTLTNSSDDMDLKDFSTTPESFYHIVPNIPYNKRDSQSDSYDKPKCKVAYPKTQERKQLARSLSIRKKSRSKKSRGDSQTTLSRSSSWPSVHLSDSQEALAGQKTSTPANAATAALHIESPSEVKDAKDQHNSPKRSEAVEGTSVNKSRIVQRSTPTKQYATKQFVGRVGAKFETDV